MGRTAFLDWIEQRCCPKARMVNDSYQLVHLAYQTDGAGTLLASYSYDSSGALTSATASVPNANGWVNPTATMAATVCAPTP